jgi:CheY-like chemotaxis protein
MPANKLVLVVDDDWDILEVLAETITTEGYQAVTAHDGLAALDYLETHEAPGLVLLDWNMAPMNGTAFMAAIARNPQLASIPVILLTADGRVEVKARDYGFAGYLKKPIEPDKLFATLARYCG